MTIKERATKTPPATVEAVQNPIHDQHVSEGQIPVDSVHAELFQ